MEMINMTIAHVMVGMPGSGKSTTTTKFENVIYLSKDAIREDLFGSRGLIDEKLVNATFNRALNDAVTKQEDLVIDNVNTSLKKRIGLYQFLKAKGYEVRLYFHLISLAEALYRNETRFEGHRLPVAAIYSHYEGVCPPLPGRDCDNFEVVSTYNVRDEIAFYKGISDSHNSPYHAETISEHISQVVENARAFGPDYELVARYHDLGKYVTRKANTKETDAATYFRKMNGGLFDQFMNHERVSAVYYFIESHEAGTYDPKIMLRIYLHMLDNISNKVKTTYRLTDELLEQHRTFADHCDHPAATKSEFLPEYLRLLTNK